MPTAGTYDYSQLRSYIKKNLYATDITRENANIVVLNATGISGVAQKQANKLTELGMTVSKVGNAPQGNAYPSNKIYKSFYPRQNCYVSKAEVALWRRTRGS